jgi:hypothetical protein
MAKRQGTQVAAGLAALWLAAPLPAHALEPVNFDTFLSGMDDGCFYSESFSTFLGSLADKLNGSGRTVIPDDVRAGIGAAKVKVQDDHFDVFVPARGTWRGHPVAGFTFALGRENGIHVTGIQFAGTLADAKAALGARIQAASERMARDPENVAGQSMELGDWGKGPVLVCDLSS